MGTHSTITARMSDGTYASIYCHWDGYPSHNGKILHENYSTQEKVEALIALGDLSSLRESPACPEGHSYRTPVTGHSIAYGRDRGEADTAARRGSSLEMLRHREQYNYLWNGSAWLMDGMPLADVLAEIKE